MMPARPWLVAGFALIGAALLLGWWLTRAAVPAADVALSKALATWRSDGGGWLALTRLGDAPARIGLAVIAVVVLVLHRRRGDAVLIAVAPAAEVGFNSVLKLVFDRSRPDLFAHLDQVTTLSYPSGHAAHSMCLLLLTGLVSGRRWAVMAGLTLALSIGVSRVVLGVHWPSDVIGGWAIGAGCALVAVAIRGALRVSGARAG